MEGWRPASFFPCRKHVQAATILACMSGERRCGCPQDVRKNTRKNTRPIPSPLNPVGLWGITIGKHIVEGSLYRSQTSDNMDRWRAETGRVREKRRVEERRSEKRKSQKKEDPGARKGRKVAKHCVFPMICGSGGLKSRLAKAAGAEPSGSQNCFVFDVVSFEKCRSLAELLRFSRCQVQTLMKSRRIAAFLMLSSSKPEDVSQNSFLFKLAVRQVDR